MNCSRILFLILFLASCAKKEDPRVLAEQAFYAIERAPFDSQVLKEMGDQIYRAEKINATDPWVLIALSQLQMELGYMSGNRFKLSSYDVGYFERAKSYAEQAVKAAPENVIAQAKWAKIQIILNDNTGAWETLNRAHLIDPENFYPRHLRAALLMEMKQPDMAETALQEAERRIAEPYQRRWVIQQKITLAKIRKDPAAEERAHKEAIAADPNEPHPYGNYAGFLKWQKRYDEAIEYYNKAIAISPYPLAVEQLRQTILLKEASHSK
jgi:tetratricopeptide (TPR) repeat protein